MAVKLNEAALTALLDSENGPVGVDILRRGNNIRNQMEHNAAQEFEIRSGDLIRSIKMEPRPSTIGLAVVVGCDGSIAPYAGFLENGTVPHEIVPVNARFLVSEPDNPDPLLSPRRQVNHPGNPPRPFVRPALEAGRL